MTDLSPMERAVRALAVPIALRGERTDVDVAAKVVEALALIRTSDPDAFVAVLAECGSETHGRYQVVEGEAVLEGRVVELEIGGWKAANGALLEHSKYFVRLASDEPLYRVKQHTEVES